MTSPPTDGRANDEAVRLLTDLLRAPVRLAGGPRSRRKLFETDLHAHELDVRLAKIFG